MEIDDCFYLGFIKKQHGLEGEVTAILDVDDPRKYKKLESVFLDIRGKLIPFFIDHIETKPFGTLIKFKNIQSSEDADSLMGASLYLPLEFLPPLTGKTQFYYHEIEGYTVIDTVEGNIGKVREVLDYPHQAVIAIENQGKEILIPVSDAIIQEVDKQAKTIHIQAPEGLIALYQ